ncbi:uncharacterized protein [Montipora capricornis]|uniref:uncharacterized protein isoform X2 n=1 Tax=Montipora capricornis TaxID=246305 RepID=UPI0035F13B3E
MAKVNWKPNTKMETQRNRTSFQEAQGIGSDPSNGNEHSESLSVHETAQALHTGSIPVEQEHSLEPAVHNTEARQSPGEATQRCCCPKDKDDGTVRAEGSYCSLCGKLIEEQSCADHLQSVRPAPLPQECASAFAFGLPSLPRENSIDEYSEDPSQAEGGGKIPVHGTWRKKSTCQIPPRSREFEFYLTGDVHPESNEQWFSVHAIPVHRYPDVPLYKILSKSQERLSGALARVIIRFHGEPGERFENRIRMTIKYGENQRNMIFPVWFHVRP